MEDQPDPFLRALKRLVHRALGRRCPVCGRRTVPHRARILWPELIAAWELAPQWVRWLDAREGTACRACGAVLRSQHLAATLLAECRQRFGLSAPDLAALAADPAFARLAVAEINTLGPPHRFLAAHPALAYSEYGSTDPAVPAEDLTCLSYPDRCFDLVLHSDTLEHVPDVPQALRELRRILKPGGVQIFTTPVIWDRPQTRRRAWLHAGRVEHLLPPSYHGSPQTQAADYLVFHEFGADFPDLLAAAGFAVRLVRHPRNPALTTFVAAVEKSG